MSNINILLSEQLRPTAIDDLILPERDIMRLKRMVESRSIPNMLFYGSPGRGKTSAARILLRELDADHLTLNGSAIERGKDIEDRIMNFASSMSLLANPKICFIDEADYLPTKVQHSLRFIIEYYHRHCRFIMTANEPDRLIDALRSRLTQISFDLKISDTKSAIITLKKLLRRKLVELNISLDPARLDTLVNLYYHDMRALANVIEHELQQDEENF